MNKSQENHATAEFTESALEELIARWQASGETRKTFCKAQGLNYKTFQRWCYARGIKRQRRASVRKKSSEPFIPIEVSSPSASSVPVAEVSYPDGRRIRFYILPEVSLLKTLLG